MKGFIISTIICFMTVVTIGQAQLEQYEDIDNNALAVTYRLFPTQNMWNFIKLNTRNGKMWQVQFDIEGDSRFETYLNILPLVEEQKEVNGRFTLYPTQNAWTFILLDQLEGKTWQVQWSLEPGNRVIIPIE